MVEVTSEKLKRYKLDQVNRFQKNLLKVKSK
jgi:hypothetical protein